ncbi:MAG: galactokinase [Chloroflexi bacterium]|nr:galactokinase [Chloroflexota bacterium]MBL7163182.1 galactokinase [Anaerolineales bacterium]
MNFNQRRALLGQEFVKWYQAKPTAYAQAPGRVDLMGSHTDYNLGFVLTQAIDRNIWIAARPRDDGIMRVRSLDIDGCGEFDLKQIEYNRKLPWTNYVGGVAAILKEGGYNPIGFDGLVHSTVPIGSGLSSSAALEVSSAILFDTFGKLNLDWVEMAKICKRAENDFVGMNCGILDQYTSVMGEAGCILLLDCRTITHQAIPIASGLQVMICDTRAKRELTGSEYPERRAQCEEGVRILAGFYPEIRSLRDATLEQLQSRKSDLEPVVFKRCKFIIEENQRVLDISKALAAGNHAKVGDLALESFVGARDLYEIVSSEMIAMKDAIMDSPGAFGVRGAGAGFGGCMVAFVKDDEIDNFADSVQQKYSELTGIDPDIYPVQAAPGAGLLSFSIPHS